MKIAIRLKTRDSEGNLREVIIQGVATANVAPIDTMKILWDMERAINNGNGQLRCHIDLRED